MHRTGKLKGCLSHKTGLATAFKLMMSAETKWRKLDGANRMREVIKGIEFTNRIKQFQNAARLRQHQLLRIPHWIKSR